MKGSFFLIELYVSSFSIVEDLRRIPLLRRWRNEFLSLKQKFLS